MFKKILVCTIFIKLIVLKECQTQKGSRRCKVLNMTVCDMPIDEYDLEDKFDFSLKSDIKPSKITTASDICVTKKTAPISLSMHFWMYDGKNNRTLKYAFNDYSCRTPLAMFMLSKINITSNTDCTINPGNYTVRNVISPVFKTFTAIASGKYEVEFLLSTKKGPVYCLKIESLFYRIK